MDANLSEVIGAIYDCVTHEDLWPPTLGRIGAMVDGFLTTLAVFDTARHCLERGYVACEDCPRVAALARHACEFPLYHLIERMEVDQPGPLRKLFLLQGREDSDTTHGGVVAADFHVSDSINMAVLKGPSRIGTINISVRQPEISPRHYQRVAMLGPHLRRAITIADMLDDERNNERIFRDIIDRLDHGVVLVSETMQILYANSAAERYLCEEALFCASAGRIAARFQPAQAALSHAVGLSMVDEADLGPTGIDVPLGLGARPAIAHVLPLGRRAYAETGEARATAAIFIAAAGVAVRPAIAAIAALFGLTTTEGRIASYVADGMTRSEIAQAQGVTEGTVKSQLAAIFDKTATGDQRSLQALMKDLTPPVRRM
jgi:DNA-binding CsgD family transcriptional regulator/PAS domain-containing protein